MLLYNLPAFEKGNAEAFLSGVARSHNLILKVSEKLWYSKFLQ
jgi:hypothetical protein